MERLLLQDEFFAQKFYLENRVEIWARNCCKESNVRKEIRKAHFFILQGVLGYFFRFSDAFKQADKDFFEDIMVLDFGLDNKRDWSVVIVLLDLGLCLCCSCVGCRLTPLWCGICKETFFITIMDIRNRSTPVGSLRLRKIPFVIYFCEKRVEMLV